MRTLTILLVAVVAFGCSSEPPGPDPQLESNKALVLKLAEAQNKWDYATLEKIIAPDLTRHCQATPEVNIRSRDDFIAFLRSWETGVPDAQIEINQMLAEGDRVAVHATFSGTQSGPMGDIPATGRSISSDYVAILRIADNQIAEIWVEWDNLAILTQLGLFPPEG
jgi:steroid delta-isomerase-like uncharacterized protein